MGAKSALMCTDARLAGPRCTRHGVGRPAAHDAESGAAGVGQVGVQSRRAANSQALRAVPA